MAIPKPRVGMVIRHSFLFSSGEDKERPAVVDDDQPSVFHLEVCQLR
jgi:hypothetical protein